MSDIATNNQRVRINLSQTAKGLVQFDITAEFPSVDESIENLSEALDKVKMLIESKGLKSVSDQA